MNQYRDIPGVDTLLKSSGLTALTALYGTEMVTFSVRHIIAMIRKEAQLGAQVPGIDKVEARIKTYIHSLIQPSLKPVINATGIVIHTNLGRAPIGEKTAGEISGILAGYSNVEFDLNTGKRGNRSTHLSELLRYVSGAQDSVVVNNNAAAVILILSTFAKRKEVIVSRGELVEIGGSFRIPDIMKASGVKMIEVGTTNKTRLSDYENAVSDKTAIIFKAHKSNYRIRGFTEEVPVTDLATLAHDRGILFVYDIGSGLLGPSNNAVLEEEPDVKTALKNGADLVSFSCDKLVGGAQAGVVSGRADLIKKLAKAPIMRALRVDKVTISILASVFRNAIVDPSAIPVFTMLSQTETALRNKAERLHQLLEKQGIQSQLIESQAQTGGGSLPDQVIKSFAVKIDIGTKSAERLYKNLMRLDRPIVAILRKGELLFDIYTIENSTFDYLVAKVCEKFKS